MEVYENPSLLQFSVSISAVKPDLTTSTMRTFINYLYPLTTVLYIAIALICRVRSSSTPSLSSRLIKLRLLTISLIGIVDLSYVAQGVIYIIRALFHAGRRARNADFIQVQSSILVWTAFLVYLVNTPALFGHLLTGSWLLCLGFELIICTLRPVSVDNCAIVVRVESALSFLRVGLLALVIGVSQLAMIAPGDDRALDGERQPLLGTGSERVTAQRSKRQEEAQSWWRYVKGFHPLLRLMWPTGNYRIQAYIHAMTLCLVADRVLNPLTPRQVGIIIDALTDRIGTGTWPWKELGVWLLLRWLQSEAGIGIIRGIAQIRVQNHTRSKLSALALGHIMSLSMDFHNNKDTGEVIKATQQAQALNDMLDLVLMNMCPIVIDLAIAIVFITRLFDAYMGFVLIMVGVTYMWLGWISTQRAWIKRQAMQEINRAESKIMYEAVSNWPTITMFGRRKYELNRYQDTVDDAVRAKDHYYIFMNLTWAVQNLVMLGGLLLVVILATQQILAGDKPVGNFVVLILYWRQLMQPLHMVATSHRRIYSILIDAERLLQLLNTKPSIQDKQSARDLEVTEGKVEFINVGFSYDGRQQTIRDLDFTAKPGKMIAIVGGTGGGKSTILKLLQRFYDVKQGSIEIDGQDVRDIALESLRDALGIVPQDPALFNLSVLDNLRYARLEATDEDIHMACKAAAVHDEILGFPERYLSRVGEGGVKLSGGQIQRIAIARVLLKNPKIVLLDEATSAIDSITEARIQRALRTLRQNRTTFVIAHRLSTIRDANTILVIVKGEISERGTHRELLEKKGKYWELWTMQTEASGAGMSISHRNPMAALPDTS